MTSSLFSQSRRNPGIPMVVQHRGEETWLLYTEVTPRQGLRVGAQWISRNGSAPVIRELSLSCEAGLDAQDLRLLSFSELRRAALLSCEEYIADDAARKAALKPLLDGIVAGPARAGRPPRYTDSDLAILTDLYVQAVAEDPRRPWDAVDRIRRDPPTPRWIRDAKRSRLQYLIHTCRKRNLLTTATPRKASGERTDYCLTLLSLTSRDAPED